MTHQVACKPTPCNLKAPSVIPKFCLMISSILCFPNSLGDLPILDEWSCNFCSLRSPVCVDSTVTSKLLPPGPCPWWKRARRPRQWCLSEILWLSIIPNPPWFPHYSFDDFPSYEATWVMCQDFPWTEGPEGTPPRRKSPSQEFGSKQNFNAFDPRMGDKWPSGVRTSYLAAAWKVDQFERYL